MPFVMRSTDSPTTEQLSAIEQIWLIDRDPTTPVTGVGSGTVLLVGEFEDGAFNTPTEVFGTADEFEKFGGFGFTYAGVQYSNPCARNHLTEVWNGNGWIKGKYLEFPRKIICRVDSSVGDVRFTLAASLRSNAGPFDMEPVDQLSVTTDAGGPANSTAVTATAGANAGGGFAPGPTGFVGGERISITVDALPAVIVTFQAADQSAAQVVARINGFMGYTAASVNAGEVDLIGLQRGSGGQLVLADVDAGTLAAFGQAAGTYAGAGNVANVDAVTAAEAVVLINSGAIAAINGLAAVDANTGEVVVYRTGSGTGEIQIDDVAGTMATDMGFTVATNVVANIGDAFTLPAGTRVRNAGGDEWVTMRTLSWPEGTVAAPNTATQDVEVRDALDDGSGAGEAGGNVTVEVDYPTDRFVEVNNPSALTAALTEAQLDAVYQTAWDATVDSQAVSREATISLCARRSETTQRQGRANAIAASNEGHYGRKFHGRAFVGWSSAQAIADVPNWRSDRFFYTWPGWRVTIPEIASRGAAGGTGFNATGEITVGGDGPLAMINAGLPPEENPGQQTDYLVNFNGIEATGEVLNRNLYIALKAAGICAPKVEQNGDFTYQTEATTDLTPGRTTQKRRKFADFAQDSLGVSLIPYSKRLATQARRDGALATLTSLLERWKSEDAPNFSRIDDYSIEETTDQHPGWEALGIFSWQVKITMYASMDVLVVDTEIGEGVIVAAAA